MDYSYKHVIGNSTVSEANLWLLCIVITAIIFMIDLLLPLGVAGGVPYVLVILFGLWSTDKRFPVMLAAICSVLTVVAFYLSPEGGELWKVIVNRALALFAIWTTALLALMWKHKEQELYQMRNRLEKEKIYFATLQGTQHIVNNLLNQLQLVYREASRQREFDKETLMLFDQMMHDASRLLKNLSEVENIDEQAIMRSVFKSQRSARISRPQSLEFRIF